MRPWERIAWLDSLVWDVRFALRGFRKAPAYALTVIGTLALGLGVLAVAFSLFSALVLRPFAVRDPYSLYTFGWSAKDFGYTPSTLQELAGLRAQKTIISEAFAYRSGSAPLAGSGASVMAVSGNYFNMLGGRICMGRPIVESDSAPDGPAVAVVGHRAWQARLNSDPNAIGRKLYLRGHPLEVVGVACPEFNGLDSSPVDFWVSLPLYDALAAAPGKVNDSERSFSIVVRLKAGLTEENAKTALLTYGRQIYSTWPNGKRPDRVFMASRATKTAVPKEAYGQVAMAFAPFFIAFGMILLIACANVSNMALARMISRQREIGVRISLGAGRARMVRQLLTESLMLALAASLAAYAVAYGAIQGGLWLMYRTLPPEISKSIRGLDLSPDHRALWFLLAAGCATALISGLAPALHATHSSLTQANRGEFGAGYHPARLRSALVVVQATVCTLLLITAVVSLRAERKAAVVDPKFDPHGVFSVQVSEKFRAETTARLAALPGASLGSAWNPPLGLSGARGANVGPEGRTMAPYSLVSPEYFALLGIPLVRGRNFSGEEAASEAPVVIVSESAARRLWPGADAIGQTLKISTMWIPEGEQRTPAFSAALVIGVARDAVYDLDVKGSSHMFLYFPASLKSKHAETLLVRMPGDPKAAKRVVQAAAEQAAPGGLEQFYSAEEMLNFRLYPYRALFTLTGVMGGLALLLTVSGVYGVLSFVVNQRRREFGIRMALGAEARNVAAMALFQTLRLALVGAAIGAALALTLARLIAHNMQPVNVYDPAGYLGGALLVITASLAASWVPALRAAHVEPWETLRSE
jgi:predicted permease